MQEGDLVVFVLLVRSARLYRLVGTIVKGDVCGVYRISPHENCDLPFLHSACPIEYETGEAGVLAVPARYIISKVADTESPISSTMLVPPSFTPIGKRFMSAKGKKIVIGTCVDVLMEDEKMLPIISPEVSIRDDSPIIDRYHGQQPHILLRNAIQEPDCIASTTPAEVLKAYFKRFRLLRITALKNRVYGFAVPEGEEGTSFYFDVQGRLSDRGLFEQEPYVYEPNERREFPHPKTGFGVDAFIYAVGDPVPAPNGKSGSARVSWFVPDQDDYDAIEHQKGPRFEELCRHDRALRWYL